MPGSAIRSRPFSRFQKQRRRPIHQQGIGATPHPRIAAQVEKQPPPCFWHVAKVDDASEEPVAQLTQLREGLAEFWREPLAGVAVRRYFHRRSPSLKAAVAAAAWLHKRSVGA